ncbi:MAG: cyclic nucleotide-binding domain-containing protein [Alsobacter sp.]
MALNQDIEALRRVPLFRALDREALRLVAFSAESRLFRAGDVIFRKGEPSDCGYVVITGTIALDAADNGAPTPHLAGPGTLIGELALITETARPATAIVREPASLLRISRATFRRVLDEYPEAALPVRALLAERMEAMAGRLGTIRTKLQSLDDTHPLSLEK